MLYNYFIMKTIYRKCTEVYSDLSTLIQNRVEARSFLLPPELRLASELGTSRMTLRKALVMAENDGLIRRDNKKTIILDRKPSLAKCGRILFVVPGENGTIRHQALERLWLKLSGEVRTLDGNIVPLLIGVDSSLDEFNAEVRKSDIILTTVGSGSAEEIDRKMLELSGDSGRKFVISLTEEFSGCFRNYIALDNILAGSMAAEELVRAGARKFLMFCDTPSSPAHLKRLQGFRERILSFRLPDPLHFLNSEKKMNPAYYMDCVEKLAGEFDAGHVDGVFSASDEGIDVILMKMFERGVIPSKLKVCTVNGSGIGLRHNPPVTCISHGTDGVVAELITQLKNIAEGSFVEPVRRLIVPKLYKNSTT